MINYFWRIRYTGLDAGIPKEIPMLTLQEFGNSSGNLL